MAREYYELVARGFSSTPDPFAAATVRGNETELRTRKDGGEWVDEKGAVHSGACDPNPRVHSTSGSRARTYSTKIVTPLSHPNGEKLSRRIKRNVRIVAETRPSEGEIGGGGRILGHDHNHVYRRCYTNSTARYCYYFPGFF